MRILTDTAHAELNVIDSRSYTIDVEDIQVGDHTIIFSFLKQGNYPTVRFQDLVKVEEVLHAQNMDGEFVVVVTYLNYSERNGDPMVVEYFPNEKVTVTREYFPTVEDFENSM